MATPIFSPLDKVAFFDVLQDISEYLHHIKQYDRVDDVIKQFDEIEKLMKQVSVPVRKIYDKAKKKEDENDYLYFKKLVDDTFRKNISFEDQYQKIKDGLKEMRIKKEDTTIWNRLEIGEDNEKDNELKNKVKNIRDTRMKVIESLEVIFQKLHEIQSDRQKMQALLGKNLSNRNEKIFLIIQNIEECQFFFQNFNLDTVIKKESSEERKVNIYKKGIINIIENLIELKLNLYNLVIERNKLKGFVIHYPAFRDELLKNRNRSIRQPLTKKELVYLQEKMQKNPLTKPFFDNIKQLKDKSISSFNLSEKNLIKEDKIFWRLLRILHNLTLIENTNILPFNNQMISYDGLDILFKNLDKILKEKNNKEKNSTDKDTDLLSNNILTWATISHHAANIYASTLEEEEKGEGRPKVDYTLNWEINDLFEDANYIYIIYALDDLLDVFCNIVCSLKLNIKWNKQNKYEEKLAEISKIKIAIHDKKIVGDGIIELENVYKKIKETITFYMGDNSPENKLYSFNNLNNEIKYFIFCNKGHIKWYNNRLFAKRPIYYKDYALKNATIKELFKGSTYRFSSSFRKIISKIDIFFEEKFEYCILKNEWDAFWKLKKYIQLNLAEFKVGQYSLLNEYLHSDDFHQITDRLQIYGGAFGVWDQEAKKLVRLQDRRYCKIRYRPSKKDIHSKWYDLSERVIKDYEWEYNESAESINLMFLAQRQQIVPEFFQNLSRDKNILNLIDKKHNCLFSEDGEISAFVLLYRFLDGICHTSTKNNTAYTLRPNIYIQNFLQDLNTDIHSSKNQNKYNSKVFDTIVTDWRVDFEQYYHIFEKNIFQYRSKKGAYDFLQNVSDDLSYIIIELNIKICICERYIYSSAFEKEVLEDLQKIDKQRFLTLTQEKEFKLGLKKFHIVYKELLKNILKQTIHQVISLSVKKEISIEFAINNIDNKIMNDAYDLTEAIGRNEKFYYKYFDRIPEKMNSFLDEFKIQGLIKYPDNVDISEHSLITITERYINLCRFIDKELSPNNIHLKVRCNFPPEFNSPINDEKFFIDKQLGKLTKEMGDDYELEYLTRERFLSTIRESIKDVVEEGFQNQRIPVHVFFNQISNILCLLLEPIQTFLTSTNDHGVFIKNLGALQKNDKKNEENDEEYIKEKRGKLWNVLKNYIDRLSKFPIAASFLWRANSEYALSQLVMPLASTATSMETPNVGFLILGIRNVIENSKNKLIHVGHENENHFAELIYTIRTIFEPLIHPYMDKVYYEQIVNETVQKNAIRAGVARVMTRNMSHNIGSHVIDNLSKEQRMGNKPGYKEHDYALFNSYLRTRMGFIADVSTGKPYYSISSPLMKNILACFLEDVKSSIDQNYTNDKNYQKILFDFIGGTPYKVTYAFNFFQQNQKLQLDANHDLEVAMPNGLFGYHALYVIIENIIRNTLKYSVFFDEFSSNEFELELDIICDRFEENPNYYQLSIIDKLGEKFQKDPNNETEKRRHEKLPKELQAKIDRPIIDPKNKQLRVEDWGFLEMKIAATYLRKIDMTFIDNFKNHESEPPILKVSYRDETSRDLRYDIFLNIPKEVEIIGDGHQFNSLKGKEIVLQNMGIKLTNYTEKIENNETINSEYRLVLVLNHDKLEAHHQQTLANIRIFRVVIWKDDYMEIINILNNPDLDIRQFLKMIWGKRIDELQKDKLNIINWKYPKEGIELQKSNNKIFKKKVVQSCLHTNENIDFKKDILDTLSPSIIFDSHGEFYPKNNLTEHWVKVYEKNNPIRDLRDACFYYEKYDSISPLAYLIKEIEEGDLNRRTIKCSEIFEMVSTSIGLLDERVETELKEHSNNEKNYGVFNRKKIYIPTQEDSLNLMEQDFLGKVSEKRILTWIKKIYKKNNCQPLDFLIIHIGIIEKLSGSSNQHIKNFIQAIEQKAVEKDNQKQQEIAANDEYYIGKVVLTSGRGNPHNIPKGVPFIPYSAVSRFLFEQPSKHHLTQILFAANMKGYSI